MLTCTKGVRAEVTTTFSISSGKSMITFTQQSSSRLYVSAVQNGDVWIAFYRCGGEANVGGPISTEDAWKDHKGYFLFAAGPPEDMEDFIDALGAKYSTTPDATGFRWIESYYEVIDNEDVLEIWEHAAIDVKTVVDGQTTTYLVKERADIRFANYDLPIAQDTRIEFHYEYDYDLDDWYIDGFAIEYPAAPMPKCPSNATPALPDPNKSIYLGFYGAAAGCLQGEAIVIDYYSQCSTSWDIGLRYTVSYNGSDQEQFYPVFDLRNGQIPLLWMCWDPTRHLDAKRTYLGFKGTSVKFEVGEGECNYRLVVPQKGDYLPTHFRTVTGEQIAFRAVTTPSLMSKLVFDLRTAANAGGSQKRYYLVPGGEFELAVLDENRDPILDVDSNKTEFPGKFMCGLSAIESVEFMPKTTAHGEGDRICFFAGQAAYAPVYPLLPAPWLTSSPLIHPRRGEPLLTSDYRTAWASFKPALPARGSSGRSVFLAQPEDAPLYYTTDVVDCGEKSILQLMEPLAEALPPYLGFPIAPAMGATPSSSLGSERSGFLKRFEAQILSPMRRQQIRYNVVFDAYFLGTGRPVNGGITAVGSAPQGVIADVRLPQWETLDLANSDATGTRIAFGTLNATLQAAFQTNRMFLVVSRPDVLTADGTTFTSDVFLADWKFKLGGVTTNINLMKNVLIFKLSPGRIVDLVQQPKVWTNATAFNFNGTGDLDRVSAWLTNHIRTGIERAANKDTAYQRFAEVVQDPNWTGIIALNAHIVVDNTYPVELQMMMSGVDPDTFNAHHIVVETSCVQMCGAYPMPGESSLFGLIDYVKPTPTGPDPALTAEFYFSVRKLRAHFENVKMKEFSCAAELTINKLFGDNVQRVVGDAPGASNRVTINGRREQHGNVPRYIFTIAGGGRFELQSSVLDSVDVRRVAWTAARVGQTTTIVSRFIFGGSLKFKALGSFDIFSFDQLAYESLMLEMTSVLTTPPPTPTFNFTTERITFDMATGATVARANSLFKRFPMKLQAMLQARPSGNPTSGLPGANGYVPVNVTIPTRPIATPWYGFEYTLNLGTLGEFAANAGITIRLLITWTPSPTDLQAQVFLKFPGVSGPNSDLFSLQGVLRLGAGSYELKSNGNGGYLLVLNNIALRALGLTIPPGGGPNIYIFGNPNPPQEGDDNLGWLALYKK